MSGSLDDDLGNEEENKKKADGCQIAPADATPWGESPKQDEVEERCCYPKTESAGILLKRKFISKVWATYLI